MSGRGISSIWRQIPGMVVLLLPPPHHPRPRLRPHRPLGPTEPPRPSPTRAPDHCSFHVGADSEATSTEAPSCYR